MPETIHKLPVPDDTPERLGRHIHHDSRSRDYRFGAAQPSRDVSTRWTYSLPVLNQWNTNACTGNAMAHFLNTDYAAQARAAKKVSWCTESLALQFYSVATREEGNPAYYYPPHDQGSDGLDVAKAAQSLGWVDRYEHCFTFNQFRAALQTQPVLMGTVWTNSMFKPDPTGLVRVGEISDYTIAGGHEWLALGINYGTQLITGLSSWGAGWGNKGKFDLSFPEFESLMYTQGDVIVPHAIGLP